MASTKEYTNRLDTIVILLAIRFSILGTNLIKRRRPQIIITRDMQIGKSTKY